MKILNTIMPFTPLLATGILSVCVAASLDEYVAPVFEPVEIVAEEESEENKDIQGDFDLEDGVYEGTGTGFAGKLKVSVTIKDRRIVSIELIDSGSDDTAFVNRAKGVIERILEAQSFDVDIVSGATYSSRGIISAVKNALTGEVDNYSTATLPTGQGSTDAGTVEEPSAYKDGTYYGSGIGFAGTTTVQVVISGGKITAISVQSTNDDNSYMSSASAVISRIIAGQTTNVDTVSGATYSSVGIIQAVRNALKQAAINETEESEESNPEEETTIIEGLFPYIDGTYYGTGEGYASDITVAVEISGNTIRSISIVEHADDAAFISRAIKILDNVVANQTTEVDVVSGATFSSEGILEAIKNALKEADHVTNGNNEEESKEESTQSPETEDVDESDEIIHKTYKDGEYTVSVKCEPDEFEDFEAYNLSVTFTIKDDKIISISDIVGDGGEDNVRYIEWATNGRGSSVGIVAQIIEKGTLSTDEVDVVSRATCTSNSIIEACQKALDIAKISEPLETEPKETEPELSETDSKETESELPENESKETESELPEIESKETDSEETDQEESAIYFYNDGTYTGKAICEPDEWEDFLEYNLYVTITIENDKIVSITNVFGDGEEDNDTYITRAVNGRGSKPGVVTQILNSGKVIPEKIDAVTNATCTSKSIVDACLNALAQAKKTQ